MFATTVFPPAFLRASFAVYALLQKFLMVAGLVFLIGLVGIQAGHSGLIDGLKTLISSTEVVDAKEEAVEAPSKSNRPPSNRRRR